MRTFLMQLLWLVVGTLSLVAVALPSPAAPAAAPSAPTFLDVKEWWGTYTITITASENTSGSDGGLAWTLTNKINRRCEGSFHLDYSSPGGPMVGNAGSSVSADSERHQMHRWSNRFLRTDKALVDIHDERRRASEEPVEGKFLDHLQKASQSSGHGLVSLGDIKLVVDIKKKIYGMIIPYDEINSRDLAITETTVTTWRMWNGAGDNEKTTTDTFHGPQGGPNFTKAVTQRPDWVLDQKLPDAVGVLKGSVEYRVPMKDLEKPVHVKISWFLSPKPPPDVELVLMPQNEETYKGWRPEAAIDRGTAGAYIPVKAKLQKKGGGAPEEYATRITFTLAEVSHEPGICINYPLMDDQPDQPDMQFVQVCNWYENAAVVDDHTIVCTDANGDGLDEAVANVTSFDYGGFCVVEARAELESGRVITAHLAADANLFSLRLPKSRADSHIADGWRADHKAQGTDISTDETYPMGNGVNGDGFSLYEKYRGYITKVNGKAGWSDLDPHTKTLFVINRVGPLAKPGFEFFHQVSNIDYREIKWEESRVSNVINFNISAGRHAVDQHGIVVRMGSSKEYSQASGGPGLPRSISAVEMCSLYAGYMPKDTVAHELLHCCCVWHHGDLDPGKESWVVEKDANGEARIYRAEVNKDDVVTSKTRIKLYSEKFADFELYPPEELSDTKPSKVWVAVPHGQHSGDEECVMRYEIADVYPKGPPNEYVWIDHYYPSRTKVCDTVWGHTFNDVAFKPRSRFFEADAESLRGFCMKQMCINDSATQKDRNTKPQSAEERRPR